MSDTERHSSEEFDPELEVRFPEQIDWIERSAALHEARGDVERAVERCRRCLDFVERHADEFDSDSADYYRGRIDRLRAAR